jgi:hypothetical protein
MQGQSGLHHNTLDKLFSLDRRFLCTLPLRLSSTIADYTSCKRWFVSELGGGTMVGQNGSCETRICCLRSRTQLAAQLAVSKEG